MSSFVKSSPGLAQLSPQITNVRSGSTLRMAWITCVAISFQESLAPGTADEAGSLMISYASTLLGYLARSRCNASVQTLIIQRVSENMEWISVWLQFQSRLSCRSNITRIS